MKKAKRVLALIGVILLLAMYGSTMVFALMDDPAAKGLLMGSIFCTIAVPVLLYAMTLVARRLKDKNEDINRERREREEAQHAGKKDTAGH